MAEVVVVPEECDDLMEVNLVGAEGVGKTALINQYSGNVQRRDRNGYYLTNIEVVHGRRIAVSVSDAFRFRHIDGMIVVFDVTNRASFDNLPTLLPFNHDFDHKRVAVIGNKTNLEGQRVVSKEEAEQFARTHNLVYLETSATDPDSTRAAFRRAIEVFVSGTAMHEAAWNGDVSKIEEAFGTLGEQSIDTPDWRGRTPMHCAAQKGNVAAIEALVRLGSKAIDTPNNDGQTPMDAAASNGHVSVIETLVRLGSNAIDTPAKNGRTPMHEAALSGHVSVIELLVRLGSNAIDTPDNDGRTPLNTAALSGRVSAIELLVRLGSNAIDTPDGIGWTPLCVAASNGHVSVIELLVRLGSKAIDTHDNGWTPLFAAARHGHVSVIETLVRSGSNAIDTPDIYGRTPLQVVPIWEPECRRVLQALRANPTSPIEVRGGTIELTEEEVLEVRYRVYFGESLTHRLLFGGALSSKDVHSSTIRIDPAVQ